MRDLDLTSLRLFVAVCETRNIARAGANANIVGSAISKRMAQLEDVVGTKLLSRRRHGVELTSAGETLLEHARAILTSTARIERDMSAYSHGLRGQVRVLATSSVLAESLAEDVAVFLQDPRHRSIRIDLEEGLSHQVIRGIKEGVASLGICWDASPLDGLQSRRYRNDHLVIVVHPSHPLAHMRSLQFHQTLDYEHVGMPVASSVQVMLHRSAAQAGQALLHRVIVSNFDSALRVVRANLGITVVPFEVAQSYADATGLVVIPLTDAWATRSFIICFRDEESLAPAARVLLEHLASVEPVA
ncbi:LysR family transcriptional regulator [Achromobacter sp. UMC46]|uniref:LysR family transcriptional regulator n=1 Tax=Achromobacter sp. UMC46 TaxID=1862319 RepID=UPI001602CBCB|nr:LysR family transcriptional regulator [Achromobacter sp. UMC46]MBB1593151.1 LysR family transcriptional regulator [Achromobacter sp. UMC46]